MFAFLSTKSGIIRKIERNTNQPLTSTRSCKSRRASRLASRLDEYFGDKLLRKISMKKISLGQKNTVKKKIIMQEPFFFASMHY